MLKIMKVIIVLGLAMGGLQHTVLAEGSHAVGTLSPWDSWGVNRAVRTNVGYVGVSGVFDMRFGLPAAAIGVVTTASNPNKDIPMIYLGGDGTGAIGTPWAGSQIEIDAGLQYQWNIATPPLGWAAFIRHNGVPAPVAGQPNLQYTHPKMYDPIQGWIPWRNTGSHFFLKHEMDDIGQISLDVVPTMGPPLGKFYWNSGAGLPSGANPNLPWPDYDAGAPVINPVLKAQNRVKRVISMTRKTTVKDEPLDGSWLECKFSHGQLMASAAARLDNAPSHGASENGISRYEDDGAYQFALGYTAYRSAVIDSSINDLHLWRIPCLISHSKKSNQRSAGA